MDRNETLTVAAQKLSEAKSNYHHAEVMLLLAAESVHKPKYVELLETARHELGVAKAVYRAAFKAYTDPFGVRTFA